MKVLNIPSSGMSREGINSMLLRWISLIDKRGLQIDVAAVHDNDSSVIKEYSDLGCRVFEMPDRKSNTFSYIIALFKLLRKEKYDVIHVHGSSAIIGIELLLARLNGVKIRIAHSRNTTCDHLKLDRILRPLLYINMNKCLACSSAAGKWLFGKRKFEIMHNGIDTEKYMFDEKKRDVIRDDLGITDRVVIGFVGNLNDQKNPLFLIDIFKKLYTQNHKYYLIIVGDGDLRKKVEKKVYDLNIIEAVKFVGRSNKVDEYLSAMDIFLFPSKYEGFGNVALEAQLSGLPLLISNTIPKDCKITKQVFSLPINKGVDSWVEQINNTPIVSNSERKDRYGRVCSAMRSRGFDLEKNAKRLRKMYLGGKQRKTTI